MPLTRRDVPNLLSASRIAAAPMLLALAWQAPQPLFLAAMALAQLSDFLDGWLARRWDARSELGARLDCAGDACTWAVGIAGVCRFYPDMVAGPRAWALGLFVLLYLARFALARRRLGEWIAPLPLRLGAVNFRTQCVLIAVVAVAPAHAAPMLVLSWAVGLAESIEYLGRGLARPRVPARAAPRPQNS